MSIATRSSSRSSSRRICHRRGSANTAIVAGIAALALLAAIGWTISFRAQQRADADHHGEEMGEITGLGRPTKNALAPEYVDADKDLVADAPTDPSKQLDPAELVFTYVASEQNTAAYEATFKPFTDAISAATGKPVRYLAVSDSDAEMNALHSGKLQLCAFNTGSVPAAVDVAGFVPVALLGSDSGPSTYQLKIIASMSSGISDITGLRGHELALTEISSNSGYKAPLVLLQQKFSLRPGFDFGIRYSFGHPKSIEGIADGMYDAAAVASDVLARSESTGVIKPTQYRVLYTSDPFPTACFGYANTLKPELAAKIRDALLALKFDKGLTADYFAASGQTKLVKVDYLKDYALVRQIDDAIGFEHKLRPVPTEDPATMPTTAPSTQP